MRPRRIDAFNGNVAKVYPSEYFTAVITGIHLILNNKIMVIYIHLVTINMDN